MEYLAGLIIDNGSQVSRVLRAVNIADGVNAPEDLKFIFNNLRFKSKYNPTSHYQP